MEAVLAGLVLAAIVVFVITVPLRGAAEHERAEEDRRADLEAAKEAKYRDIRDAELDYRMGKLSDADWRAADRELRAQAIEILRELDALGPARGGLPAQDADSPAAPPPPSSAAREADPSAARDADPSPAREADPSPAATPPPSAATEPESPAPADRG